MKKNYHREGLTRKKSKRKERWLTEELLPIVSLVLHEMIGEPGSPRLMLVLDVWRL